MSLRKQAFSGLIWTFSQQFGNQVVGFVVSLVLARILLPEEFGLIAMIAFFISLGQVFVDSGLTQSLIRTQNPDQTDYSTVFYFNLVVSFFIYGLVYVIAPFISSFYNQDILTEITRLYSLTFIINAFSTVQQTILTKLMKFKIQAFISMPATLLGGLTGIYLAYKGYGVWSLVWSHLVSSILSTVQLWFYSSWRPTLSFSKNRFCYHFKFGYKLLISGVLNKAFNNIYLLIIGKFFSPAQLGFYTRAETMNQLPARNISNALNKVTYPLFSQIRNNDLRLKRVYKQLMQLVVFVIAPILIFMAILAEPIFRFLFTEKWLPAVPYFQIIFISGILAPIHSYNLNILKIKGRSDLILKLSIVKKGLIFLGIIIGLQFGLYGLLVVQVLLSVLFFFLNGYYTNRFIKYSLPEQIKDILPVLLISFFVGSVVLFIDYILQSEADLIRISVAGLVGFCILLLLSYIFKLKGLILLKTLFRNRFN